VGRADPGTAQGWSVDGWMVDEELEWALVDHWFVKSWVSGRGWLVIRVS
jgi:hypothetical protein